MSGAAENDDSMTLDAERFAVEYAERSGVSLDVLLAWRHVVECGAAWGCDDENCEGWAMVPLDYTNTRGIPELGNTVAYPSPGGS